jgi:hypothetical protein
MHHAFMVVTLFRVTQCGLAPHFASVDRMCAHVSTGYGGVRCAPTRCAFAARRFRRVQTAQRVPTRRAASVEMLGEVLVTDDLLTSCAPWGSVCVSFGTHYVPIALPSIIASLVLFVPLAWALREMREKDKELFALRERLGENDDE